MNSLPIVSLTSLSADDAGTREKALAQLGRACRDIGFFYLSDHGIEPKKFEQVFRCAEAFFKLPLEEKNALSIRRSPHNRGYIAMADEQLNPESGADLKEAFNIGVELPKDHPDVISGKPFRGVNFWPDIEHWKTTLLEYFDQCVAIGSMLHRGFSKDLGLSPAFFDPYLTNPIATLRMLHYPGCVDANRHDAGAGAHTDYGNITLLATDGVPGLEVLNRQGEWIDAPSIPGAFVCNIGDCLMRWSNDTYVSTAHRVRAPKAERYSIAFFLEVNPDAMVDPRDIFPNQPPKYEPVKCADYLAGRLNATYGYRNQS